MSNEKFTFPCDLDGNSSKQNFNILTSKFGDGYEQNISVGINNRKGEWVRNSPFSLLMNSVLFGVVEIIILPPQVCYARYKTQSFD